MSIREKAEAATSGPWAVNPAVATVDAFGTYGAVPVCAMLWPTELRTEAETEANAAFIAAANPQAVIALLDEIETLRKALEAAAKELREAEDKFWVMHCNHPGDDPRKDMLVRRHDEDKAFMAELSKRMGNAAERARSALSHNQR